MEALPSVAAKPRARGPGGDAPCVVDRPAVRGAFRLRNRRPAVHRRRRRARFDPLRGPAPESRAGVLAADPRAGPQRAAGPHRDRFHVRAPQAPRRRASPALGRSGGGHPAAATGLTLHSTVTLLARLRGWSMSVPLSTAT